MMAVSSFERSLTEEKLHDAEQRLQKSLQQIVVIDSQIRELEILYKRAQKSKKKKKKKKKKEKKRKKEKMKKKKKKEKKKKWKR